MTDKKGKILIVDDHLENLELLYSILSKNGYEVRRALNGTTAIRGVKNIHPDLILLDINMPDMNGYDVCREIKRNKDCQDIPIIFISALDDGLDKVKAFSAGGVDYITKPFEIVEVLSRIENHLQIKATRDKLCQVNAKLEKMVLERTQELQAAKDEMEQETLEIQSDRAMLEYKKGDEDQSLQLCDHLAIGIFQTDSFGNAIYTNRYLKNFCISDTEKDINRSWLQDLHLEDQIYLRNIGVLETGKFIGHLWMENIHPDDQWKVVQSFNDFVQGKGLFNHKFRIIRTQEDIRWVMAQGTTLIGSNGEVIGHVGTIVDITDHKQVEENLRQLNITQEQRVLERTTEIQQANLKLRLENKIRKFHEAERERVEREFHAAKDQLQAVLDAVPGNISWVSADYKFLGFNQKMADTFQLNPEDFVGKEIKNFDHKFKDYICFLEDFINDTKLTSSTDLEFKFEEDFSRHYLLVGQKYANGQAAVFVAIEITNLKHAELEIHRALEATRELSDLKSRFIFMASHEFRTPLTSILSASELLENYSHKWSPEKNLKYLKQIQDSVHGINNLLEDILIIGSESSGKLKIKPTELDIVNFCQDLIEEYALDKNNHNVFHFTNNTQIRTVLIDHKLLRHILSNLLSNAIKYSPEEAPIHLKLCTDHEQIIIQVIDQGIGIPKEDQKYLFDLFHRSSNVGTIKGTGIGLSIVKKSVDAMGGNISFESDVQSGTQFTISIPIVQNGKDYQW